MNSQQLGRFKLSDEIVRRNPEKVAAVFAMLKCVPVRIEVQFWDRTIEYMAISERFAEVPEGNPAPEYTITIDDDSTGWPATVTVEPMKAAKPRDLSQASAWAPEHEDVERE